MGRTILEVQVVDAQKRRFPSKHYVYVIHVHWSDDTSYVIYRRYSRFFDFQVRLLDMFPDEAGSRDPTQRIIPFLPGKKWIGRSNIRRVAMERLSVIDEYCRALIRLPSKISECPFVHSFFETLPEDLNSTPTSQESNKKKNTDGAEVNISEPVQLDNYVAIADYKKQKSNELDLQGGDIVEVIEKNHTGWWFVSLEDEQGWVPATYLEKSEEDGGDDDFQNIDMAAAKEKFVTVHNYTAQLEDEMSFDKGVIVEVVKKNLDGWWFVRYQDKEGWVPATYLHKVEHQNDIAPKLPTERIGNVMDLTKPKQQAEPLQENRKSFPSKHLGVPSDADVMANSWSPLLRHKPPPRRGSIQATHRGLGSAKEKPEYVTIGDFQAMMNDGISFVSGQKVKVLEKAPGGWWYVSIDNKEGWAPSNYIEKQSPKTGTSKSGIQTAAATPTAKPSKLTLPQIVETTHDKPEGPIRPMSPRRLDKNANKPQNFPSNLNKPSPPRKPVVASKPRNVNDNGGGDVGIELQKLFAALKGKSETPGTGSAAPEGSAFRPQTSPRKKPMSPPPSAKPARPKAMPPPRPPPPNMKPSDVYTVLADYDGYEEGTLTLEAGMKVEVIEKDTEGWWLVKTADGVTGWAPTTYLVKQS
ncbi:SH3 and PX domain-containing protein 2A-like isoform X2 [Ptychodera flava]|uniref:SH3 and PX domain-containing protein 2A-like isoform X2 n=1 Tax=Ptychodera flava TaxID=63121 RepID=UPI00396A79AD